MKTLKYLTIILSITAITFSCKKEDDIDPQPSSPAETGTVNLWLDAMAGHTDFVMNQSYTNASGESFSVSKFQYYISNIKFIKADGSAYRVPTSGTNGYY